MTDSFELRRMLNELMIAVLEGRYPTDIEPLPREVPLGEFRRAIGLSVGRAQAEAGSQEGEFCGENPQEIEQTLGRFVLAPRCKHRVHTHLPCLMCELTGEFPKCEACAGTGSVNAADTLDIGKRYARCSSCEGSGKGLAI